MIPYRAGRLVKLQPEVDSPAQPRCAAANGRSLILLLWWTRKQLISGERLFSPLPLGNATTADDALTLQEHGNYALCFGVFPSRNSFQNFFPLVNFFGRSGDTCWYIKPIWGMAKGEGRKGDALTEMESFDKTFAYILDELTTADQDPGVKEALVWFRRVLEFNVPHGKKNRGLSVVATYKLLKRSSHIPEEDDQQAAILGWCVEMLQAFFLVADDIMDQSHTRRGQPCWYKTKDVGLVAINDAFFLENAVYSLIKSHFSGQPCYVKILELFHEVTMQTITGQCLDMVSSRPDEPLDFTRFTSQRYDSIVKYKTAYYSFYLPVALAMYLAGIYDADSHQRAKVILLEMGHFFQVQDDYLDCYGEPEVLGKIGTDIQDKKCGWLIVEALKLCSPEQRQSLEKNYGIDTAENIAAVKEVYRALGMEDIYRQFEEDSAVRIKGLIKQFSGELPESIFESFFNKIFKRNK
ncbi:Farnesyl pyrophosphate synthase [Hypsibius exemplaris]|uniref:Farnesyl pyrophosphate synthase n=1 Tax=Hypsibius exemplaris TaxID=2072580 RepID=A0A1W0WY65_HYPEX|nr:Farnesyl pyrophosphate synthase [Hypsibius exemplaris]